MTFEEFWTNRDDDSWERICRRAWEAADRQAREECAGICQHKAYELEALDLFSEERTAEECRDVIRATIKE